MGWVARACLYVLPALVVVLTAVDLRGRELPESVVKAIRATVAPAYRTGDPLELIGNLSPLVAKLNDEQMVALDGLLEDEQVPPAADLLVQIRTNLALYGTGANVPPPSNRELKSIIESTHRMIQAAVDAREKQRLLDDEPFEPSTFEDFENAAWEAHVYRNQLENAANLTLMAKLLSARNPDLLDLSERGFARDHKRALRRLFHLQLELHERDIELKVKRLRYAIIVLESDEPSDVNRLLAAYVIRKDGDLLSKVFSVEAPGDKGTAAHFFFAKKLNSSRTRGEIRQLVRQGRKLAGVQRLGRSEHLFDGLHWWLRGRYGRGTEFGGLLKMPAAADNVRAQMALRMPKVLPRPTDPRTRMLSVDSASDQNRYGSWPDYDRRHLYIWSQVPPKFLTQDVGLFFH